MAIIKLGAGSYTNTLPEGQLPVTNAEHFGHEPISPLVTDDFIGAVPTSDWASSIVMAHMGNETSGDQPDQYSSNLFAHPIGLKADANGVNIGYSDTPTFFLWNGEQVKYEYRYKEDISIRLDGMNATETKLSAASDWLVTARWEDSDSSSQLEATFGHGSPFTYFERTGNDDVVVELNKVEQNSIGQPNATTETFTLTGVNGTYNDGQLKFNLEVNAIGEDGDEVANSAQVRVSIDSDGDGKFDYLETNDFVPLDAAPTLTEQYTDAETRGDGGSVIGEWHDLSNATIRVEVWQPNGPGQVELYTGESSYIELPIESADSKLYLKNDGTLSNTAPNSEVVILGEGDTNGPSIPWDGEGTVWYHDANVIGVTINGSHYGLFAPEDSSWELANGKITSDLNGKEYFSTALLPDNSVETLNYFHQHAYAFVTDTKVTYTYDQNNSVVNTDYTLQTDLKEAGFSDVPLTTLYRHQWINSGNELTDYSYNSARGEMKLYEGSSFSTNMQYNGMLPALPNLLDTEKTQLVYNYVDNEYQKLLESPIKIPNQDTYGAGKELGEISELVQLAQQVNHEEAKNYFVQVLKDELEDWFTADGTSDDKQFYYNAEWDTFQGYPASFHSNTQVNDHHFHYGYFVKGAATVAQYDPTWADNWGGMVEMLIKDSANIDRETDLFPYLRTFDPYAGHSWASGHGGFFAGNNQESSSEAINFSSAILKWGAQTENQALIDLGTYLYTTEVSAIQQYWFDVDNAVFPDAYTHDTVGMIWGDGASYSTWFSGENEMIHGINYLPITGSSLYLGLDPEVVRNNYETIIENNGGPADVWAGIIWQYLSFYDPQLAAAKLDATSPAGDDTSEAVIENGETRAHTYHWINNMNELGVVDDSVTADTPFFAVFNNEGLRTYTAYNPTNNQLTVTYSDGTVIVLEPEEFVATNADKSWSSITGLTENQSDTDDSTSDTDDSTSDADDSTSDADDSTSDTDDSTSDTDDSGTDDSQDSGDSNDDVEPPPPSPESGEISGTANNDTLHGTSNNDTLNGLAGDDILHGNSGNDTLLGGTGQDVLHGNAGGDQLYGGDGDDSLYGNEGNDTLTGGAGSDFLVGGAGNNTYVYNEISDSTNSAMDIIEGFQTGKDKIDISATGLSFADLTIGTQNGYTIISSSSSDFALRFTSTYSVVEADIIAGSETPTPEPEPEPVPDPEPEPVPDPEPEPDQPASIEGTANPETLVGTSGDDVVYAYAGNDVLHGLNGNDVLDGGAGTDYLHGNDGNDTLRGGEGDDFLFGNNGDDILHGGSGADLLVGGAGNDTYLYTSLSDSNTTNSDLIENFESGHDKIDLSNLGVTFDDITFSSANGYQHIGITATDFDIRVLSNAEFSVDDFILSGETSDPTPEPEPDPESEPEVNAINGTDGSETLTGTLEDDVINGLGGNDVIHGIPGNDILRGGAGNDSIYGNEGDDTIDGGEGMDFLVGGSGKDTYVYNALSDSTSQASDTIEAFVSDEDVIDLVALDLKVSDINITQHNGLTTLSVNETDFEIKFIATGHVDPDDVLL